MASKRSVVCGGVQIGGGAPVRIQSMCNTDTRNWQESYAQVCRLAEAGCEIVRLAIPDMEAARGFGELKKRSPLPLVADIHFDWRLALAAMDEGADKIRINPGNIGSEERVRAVYEKAKACGIPVRIGVNSGSLEKDLVAKYGGVTAEGLVESARGAIAQAERLGFDDLVISIKSADVRMNHRAHKLLAAATDRPVHIGLTEAGAGRAAEVKSAAALGALLLEGIGDTMRVSLTGDPVREVVLAKQILSACGLARGGIDFVSCPTCGRTQVDLSSIAERVEQTLAPLSARLEKQGRSLRVAVMGCEVNGPGEAKSADVGVACGKGIGLILRGGEAVRKVSEEEIVPALLAELEKVIDE